MALILVALLLGACAGAPTPTTVPPAPTQPQPAATTAATAATAAPGGSAVTVTDDAKRSVTVPAPPQRIVSLAPSTTEIAYALGLDTRIAAVDTFSDYPSQVKGVTKVNTAPLNLEQVVSLKPDLVLAAGITSQDDVKKLADLKLPVVVVGAPSATFENTMASITLVGRATGTADKAKAVTDGMQAKLDALRAKFAAAKSKPKVFWELDATDPSKPYTPGPGSFIDQMITLAGGTNVAADSKSPYAQINAEQVIAGNPDVIILSDAAYGTTVESVKARQGWAAINAVKNNKVFPIDDNLVSRPGPRIVDGLEAAGKLIHPELF